MSWTGLCGGCGPILKDANNDSLHGRKGEPFAFWRRQMAASVGAVLLDDLEAIVETERQ